MFEERTLPPEVADVRDDHAPGALVLSTDRDFETLRPEAAEDLGLLVDSLSPETAPDSWLPDDAPAVLRRYAGGEFTVGMPGDGSVAWTRRTDPPVVLVKPRVRGSPSPFVDFLVAEALVHVGLVAPVDDESDPVPVPEHFLGFFRERYPALDRATPLSPTGTYQLAAALYDGWLGLHARETFAGWLDERPNLGDAWHDAGERLSDRLDDLPRAVARGDTEFADAAELACGAIKHAMELPAPFAALDADAYRTRGAPFAVAWAERTFEALAD